MFKFTLSFTVLLITLVFIPPVFSQPLNLKLEAVSDVYPGEVINAFLYVTNKGNKPISTEAKEVEIYVVIPLLNKEFQIYSLKENWYETISPGKTNRYPQTIKVPFYTPPAVYLAKVSVYYSGRKISTVHSLKVKPSPYLYLLLATVTLVVALLVYSKAKISRVKYKIKKMEYPKVRSDVNKLVEEKKKVVEAISRLEKDFSKGKISETVYNKLKDEYEDELKVINDKIQSEKVRVKERISRAYSELEALKLKMEEVEARRRTKFISNAEFKIQMETLKSQEKKLKKVLDARRKEERILEEE